MDSQAFIKDLMQKLMELDGTKLNDFEGCTEEEIQLLMKTQNVDRLPQIYIEFMKAMGKHSDKIGRSLFVGEDIFYEDVFGLKDSLIEYFQEENIDWQDPEKVFVFWAHQGYEYYFFRVDEGDNAPIFSFLTSGGKKPVETYKSFADLLDSEFRQWESMIIQHRSKSRSK